MTTDYPPIVQRFLDLVRIDGESRNERATALYCKEHLESLGAKIVFDHAGEACGSDCGNLLAIFEASASGIPALMLNSHMDTVIPGKGIKPIIENGCISSDKTTILGADNRAGLAAIIEGIRLIKEEHLPHGRIEVLLTVCEEIGLLGAKNCQFESLLSLHGYSLDSSGLGAIITSAPGYEAIDVTVHGRASHSGVDPESGVNAIQICSEAVSKLPQGRIDELTTCNIGTIQGGKARNIIADVCRTEIEIRSHHLGTLEQLIHNVESMFLESIRSYESRNPGHRYKPRISIMRDREFNSFSIPENHELVDVGRRAVEAIGRTAVICSKMGGSDANIFNERGISTVILGTGQTHVHSLDEKISIKDLVAGGQLIPELIREWNSYWAKQIT